MKLAVFWMLGSGVLLSAPPPSAPPSRSVVTERQLERWTQMWQQRLDLGDWRVITEAVHVSDLKPDTLGNLRWNSANRTATIHVLDPADYDLPPSDVPEDIEYTIVHELIHLQLSVLPRDPNAKIVEERVVNKLAEALLQLEKGDTYRPRTYTARSVAKTKSSAEANRSSH